MLDVRALQRDLQEVFDRHGVAVVTGLLRGMGGVAIISQDARVTAREQAPLRAYGVSTTDERGRLSL